MSELEYDTNGRVDRKFTAEWAEQGAIRVEKIPDLVRSLVEQRTKMIAYIELLHNKLDHIMETNGVCDIPECHTANCTSDHK